MSNRPRNTTDEMLAVVNAQKQGLTIEVARRSDAIERFAPMTNPAFNFMDFRYRVRKEPRSFFIVFSGTGVVCGCSNSRASAEAMRDRRNRSYSSGYHVVETKEVLA